MDKIDTVLKFVANERRQVINSVFYNTRKREIVLTRQIAMKICYDLKLGSYYTIGKKIGNKAHATVLHANKAIDNLFETDKDFNRYFTKIYRYIEYKVSSNKLSSEAHCELKKKKKYNLMSKKERIRTFAFNN